MSIRLMGPNELPGHAKKPKKAVDKQRLSTCKVCRHGVYDSDDRVWARGRLMGWCHTACAAGAS